MPHAFCRGMKFIMVFERKKLTSPSAQTILIHVAWAALSGLCASVTLSTAAIVFSSCPRFFRL